VKAIILALVALLSGCWTPCERTARHAVAMGRACKDVGDEALKKACESAYESVRRELTTGDACKAEVAP
jgi:hypothetical protein